MLTLYRKVGFTGKCAVIGLSQPCLFCQTPKSAVPLLVQPATAPMKYPDITFTNNTGARKAGFNILN